MSQIVMDQASLLASSLDDVKSGQYVTIRRHHSRGAVRQRLMDLGLMPNTRVMLVRSAPLNDPIELRLDATDITLRRHEAATIEVMNVSNEK